MIYKTQKKDYFLFYIIKDISISQRRILFSFYSIRRGWLSPPPGIHSRVDTTESSLGTHTQTRSSTCSRKKRVNRFCRKFFDGPRNNLQFFRDILSSGIEVVILRFNIRSIFNEAGWFYDVQCSLSIVNVSFISVKNFNYHNYTCYVIIHIRLHQINVKYF